MGSRGPSQFTLMALDPLDIELEESPLDDGKAHWTPYAIDPRAAP